MHAGADSSARQRLFVAIPCPLSASIQAMLDELRAAQRVTGSGLRVVAADTLHVTLKFLGATAEDRIPDIRAALSDVARMHEAFCVELRSVGSFHSALWLGVALQPRLLALAQGVDAAFETLGFAADAKALRPHVTLARLSRNPRFDQAAWLRQHRDTQWATMPVREVHLYRSDTRADGARYSIVHTASLR